MKTYIPYSLILAAASVGMAFGAETAYTTPVGYSTQTLSAGFNMAGLTLQTPTTAAGAFTAVAGKVLTNTGAAFAPVAGRLYVLEITSGALIGTIQEVPAASITATTITTTDNLQTSGLQVGDKYKLRVAPTLEEIFTTTALASGGVLDSALSVGSSDVVWVPDGSGGFQKYYLRTSAGVGAFRSTPANVPTPNVPVVYVDGLLIEKKAATAASLTVSGEVKTQGSNSTIAFGYNLVSIVAPVGLNLFNAGLEDDLTAALSSGSADEVWVQQAGGAFAKYYRRSTFVASPADSGWRLTGSTPANTPITEAQAAAITLPNSLLINKKAAGTTPLSLKVPASYSGL